MRKRRRPCRKHRRLCHLVMGWYDEECGDE